MTTSSPTLTIFPLLKIPADVCSKTKSDKLSSRIHYIKANVIDDDQAEARLIELMSQDFYSID